MTESYITDKEYIINKWNGKILKCDNKKKNTIVDNLKIFYINPNKSIKRRENILYQFKKSNIDLDKVERVEPTLYPSVADYKLKNNILSLDHIRMWQKSFDQNLDGALFFEDDIYFLKDWKNIIQNIFDEYKKVDILRFDSAPLISTTGISKDEIAVFSTKALACLGGYYMSRDAITTALTIVKTSNWSWITIETLVYDIIKQYFLKSTYETSPRICIQNWFLGDGSALQKNKHMKRLKDVQCNGYLQRYNNRYIFDKKTKVTIKNIIEEYKNNKTYEEKIIS